MKCPGCGYETTNPGQSWKSKLPSGKRIVYERLPDHDITTATIYGVHSDGPCPWSGHVPPQEEAVDTQSAFAQTWMHIMQASFQRLPFWPYPTEECSDDLRHAH